MESLHHAIMSEKWAREQGCDDAMTREIVFWSMMPDLVLATIGYQHRGLTHMEDEPSILGSQLHHTTEELSPLYISPYVPVIPHMSCAARVGLHLHLAQDSAYDAWISRYVGARRGTDGEWEYFRQDNGSPLAAMDVTYLKRWSWRCAWMETIADELSDDEMSGEKYPAFLMECYIEPAKDNARWHPIMEEKLKALWGVEMAQERPPASISDIEDDMREQLEIAWEVWRERLLG